MTVPSESAESIVSQSIPGGQDTIVALATPPGRGAISVVRMSGREALEMASRLIHPWPLEPRRSSLCRITYDDGSTVLDQALVTVFPAPDSFTGENLIEISGHGGHYVPAVLLSTLVSVGARPPAPGEFTRRAVLNGKLDILQAEAIGDIVDARSGAMHRAAMGQLDGGLSRRIDMLRRNIITVESLIAYDIDFPEEDDGPIARERMSAEVELLLISLDALMATVPVGEMVREGAVVVIAGEPNVGKSSLFNALLGQSRAIVTEIPGTTRDAIEGFLETARWPLRLVDTAGLRETEDTVERIGIEVSERYLSWADVVLACGDSNEAISAAVTALEGKTAAQVLRVRTKADLESDAQTSPMTQDIRVSAETGVGLETLMAAIDETLSSTIDAAVADMPILTRGRHIHGIREAREEVAAFAQAWEQDRLPAPVAAVHLRAASTALESVIGGVSTEDVLDRVFSSFCVGK